MEAMVNSCACTCWMTRHAHDTIRKQESRLAQKYWAGMSALYPKIRPVWSAHFCGIAFGSFFWVADKLLMSPGICPRLDSVNTAELV